MALEWTTPIRDVSLNVHWRLMTTCILCTFASFGLWWWRFPDVMLFEVFWIAAASGCFVGAILGGTWEIETSRDRVVSGKIIFGSIAAYGAFSLFGISLLYSDMQNEQQVIDRFRSMEKCQRFVVTATSGREQVIDNPEQIANMRNAAIHARLFYLSHESTTPVGQIVFHLNDLHQLRFDIVRSNRQGRLLLQFPGVITEPHFLHLRSEDWLPHLL